MGRPKKASSPEIPYYFMEIYRHSLYYAREKISNIEEAKKTMAQLADARVEIHTVAVLLALESVATQLLVEELLK